MEQGYQRPYKVASGRSAGKVFVRIGSSTRQADSATVERLHLQSTGISWDALPEGLDLGDLGTGISVLRNPVIARAFSEVGLIEGWGTGIMVAMRQLAKRHLPPASIEMRGFFTQVSSVWAWPRDLKDEEVRIMKAVSSGGRITSTEVAKLVRSSERTARTRLARLAKRGLLKKVGSTRSAAYILERSI